MRKVVLKMSVSIDGFVSGPNGEIDWIFKSVDADAKAWVVNILSGAGVHIMGSRTFRDMAAYWPASTEPFAAPMNEIPKVVFSQKGFTPSQAGEFTTTAFKDASGARRADSYSSNARSVWETSWANSKVASGDIAEEIAHLKQQQGNYILAHGGAQFARSLTKLGLIDEYRLLVHPVALGSGLPIFSALPKPVHLKLLDITTFPTCIVAYVYQPV
ncbi:MAG: dihydrofolate reductase family protein [Ignavibacteriaceae bacterium]|nr:dihydrofolate reductase family protein [Ignavibacteriaceae bacterium]